VLTAARAPVSVGKGGIGYTRRGFNWADRYPHILDALRSLHVRSTTIDGEAGLSFALTLRSLIEDPEQLST